MSADPFHLNRPVHLASRDVFYTKAADCINEISTHKKPEDQLKLAQQALYMLREARRHAEVANLSEKTSTQNRLFIHFLSTAVDNTESVAHMLSRQIAVSAPNNPLNQFLSESGAKTKMAGHYRRCATLVLKGLLSSLQQAEKPYEDLRRTSLAKMTFVDKARYEKAHQQFNVLANQEAEKAADFPASL